MSHELVHKAFNHSQPSNEYEIDVKKGMKVQISTQAWKNNVEFNKDVSINEDIIIWNHALRTKSHDNH